MKKVVLATLLACVVIALGVSCALAQTTASPAAPPAAQPVNLGAQAAAAPCALPDAEFTAYNNAISQSNPQAKAAGIEKYLTDFPTSACPNVRVQTLVILMTTYSQFDAAKTLDAADRVLKLDPNNLRALYGEAALRKSSADALTDPAAKQAALDTAADYAKKALAAFAAPKPADMPDADFQALKASAVPSFYNIIGTAALNKKDTATAIDAYKKELASVPVAQTQAPGTQLQDTYYLGVAYYESTPPDLLNCAYYGSRFVALAPEPFKTQYASTPKYCYHKYHDGDDGYDTFMATAKANLNPPDGFFATIKPGLTPAEKIHNIIATTPDLSSLAISDKEMVFQYGSPDDAAKVWDTIKGKSFEIPGGLVITSSPTVLTVAVTDDAKQAKTADFTFNMTPAEPLPELKEHATVAQKAAYKKAVAADYISAYFFAAAVRCAGAAFAAGLAAALGSTTSPSFMMI